MKITLETLDVAGIPALCLAPEGARKRPLVIYLHTLNGSKEEALCLRIIDGVGHAFNPEMQAAALDWIRQAFDPG